MKKVLVLGALCALVTGGSAQVKAYKTDQMTNPNSVAYALPRTVVKVRVVAEKESVRVGPYARFAQKYLGVIAPLADKDIYTIKSATLCGVQEADPAEVYALDNPDKSPVRIYDPTPEGFVAAPLGGVEPAGIAGPIRKGVRMRGAGPDVISYVECDTAFLKVPIDKQSTVEKSAESMAADAANMIFSLRRHRLDLVTGEAGENVFGGGLKAALDEISRLEQEYLALFLGKQYRQTVAREYNALPSKDENTLVVCRFSDTAGLLPDNDLSARPITLEMTPEKKAEASPLANRNKEIKGGVFYRIADMVNCRLTDGNRQIAQARMPIYQFGVVVQVPVTAVK